MVLTSFFALLPVVSVKLSNFGFAQWYHRGVTGKALTKVIMKFHLSLVERLEIWTPCWQQVTQVTISVISDQNEFISMCLENPTEATLGSVHLKILSVPAPVFNSCLTSFLIHKIQVYVLTAQ